MLLLSFFFIGLFILFSYTVAKEMWQQVDFDTMVKLQDRIIGRFDGLTTLKIDQIFSYFSLWGSAEITVGICLVMVFISLIRRKWSAILGWSMIVPATLLEVFGKLMVFHPGPPRFFHRSLLPTSLPSFYVHTDFSYPSGHMTRTVFVVTILVILLIFSSKNIAPRFVALLLLLGFVFSMGITRVYLGEHWLSDVLGGGILGLAFGLLGSVLILRVKKS